MNATDDGDEPMGEAPEMVTMPRVAALVDRQADALRVIRVLHTGEEVRLSDGSRHTFCTGCDLNWPCATVRAIRERDLC